MKELLISLIVATLSGATWLAYVHPIPFRRLAGTVGFLFVISFFAWVAFNLSGALFLGLGGVDKESEEKIVAAANARAQPYVLWTVGCMIAVSMYGLFLYKSVSYLKDRGPTDAKKP